MGMFMWMPYQLMNLCTISSIRIRAGIVAATSVASSAYYLLVRERLFDVSVYPFCVDFIHRMRGPWIMPRRI